LLGFPPSLDLARQVDPHAVELPGAQLVPGDELALDRLDPLQGGLGVLRMQFLEQDPLKVPPQVGHGNQDRDAPGVADPGFDRDQARRGAPFCRRYCWVRDGAFRWGARTDVRLRIRPLAAVLEGGEARHRPKMVVCL
jgi:hypothetical protein